MEIHAVVGRCCAGCLQWNTRSSYSHEPSTGKGVIIQSMTLFIHTLERFVPASQKAVLIGDKGEPVEGVVGAGAGVELRGPTHRARNYFSGELGVDMLSVSRASLEDNQYI